MISEFEILYPLAEKEIQKSYENLLKAFAQPDANKNVLYESKAFIDLVTMTINAAEKMIVEVKNNNRDKDIEIQILSAKATKNRVKKYEITQQEKMDLYQKLCYNLSYQQFQNPHLTEKKAELSEAKRMATIQRSNDIDNIYPLFSQR